jgi:tRNA A-37 threonylcarbamoyl transferase component Bud32/ActR/RegA family two-component response regulator
LPYEARKQAAAIAYTGLCLVVHDDLELRLRLAGLVRRALPMLDAHCLGGAGLENLSLDQLRAYGAVLIIVEFMQKNTGSDPLTAVARLRARAPLMPIFVFARHGNERLAARAMKTGAVDYWPIHAVDVAELAAALRPHIQPGPDAQNAPKAGAAATDAGDYPEVAGYRLLKSIAHTSASTVYLARNSDLGQMVALKVQKLQGLASVSDEHRQRFARECGILSSLNHRSIADVIDFGITPEYLYLALEYFPCGSMRERLKNPVSESDALNYARQIAGALQVVHAAGIVHRDLKPSNLMLTTENRPVLIDFGSARAQLIGHELSPSDLMTGTPYYVCPEQVDGNDPDQRGDLYSLGIIFYEMLACRLPFTGNKLTDIFDGHRNGPIPLLPAPLARYQPLIDRLLAKKPDDRYASAQHFLEALDAAAATKTAKGSPT